MSRNSRDQSQENRHLIWVSGLLAALMIVAAFAIPIYALVSSLNMDVPDLIEGVLIRPLFVISYAVVGGLVLARYPRHVVGWLLLVLSGVFLSSIFVGFVVVLVVNGGMEISDPVARVALWISFWNWIPQFALPVVFLPLYFPTGRLLSRRWRIVSAAAVVAMISFMAANAISPATEIDGQSYANPLVVPGGEAISGILNTVSSPFFIFAFFGALASMIVRYRRAGATERLQMKWLFYPIGIAIIWWVPLGGILSWIAPQLAARIEADFGLIPFFLVTLVIPVAIGVAILRYRLFDIDVIIRRTLVYGMVTAALAVIYFGSVVLLQQLSARLSGEQSPVAIVISTLLIAAMFSPVRRRVQEFIDRRFYRTRYNKEQTLDGFAQAARDETDLEVLTAELVSVVQATMQPESIRVWLRPVVSRGSGAQGRRGAEGRRRI